MDLWFIKSNRSPGWLGKDYPLLIHHPTGHLLHLVLGVLVPHPCNFLPLRPLHLMRAVEIFYSDADDFMLV